METIIQILAGLAFSAFVLKVGYGIYTHTGPSEGNWRERYKQANKEKTPKS